MFGRIASLAQRLVFPKSQLIQDAGNGVSGSAEQKPTRETGSNLAPSAPPKSSSHRLNEQHVFSDDIRHQIQRLNKSDNFHGILLCLQDWAIITFMITLSLKTAACFPENPLLISLTYVLAILIIGARMRALSILAHDSSHGYLADDKRLNAFLGTALTGWPIMQSWSGYYKSHVIEHHQHLGNPDRDPDFIAMINTGLYSENTTRNDVLFYLLSIPTPETTLLHIRYFITYHVFPEGETRKETIARAIYWALIISISTYFNALPMLVIYWLVPLLTTENWFASFLDVMEHYPLLTKAKRINILQSRNRFLSGIERFFFGIHSEGYHLVHHLWPRLPCWNMKEAHEIMMMDSEYKRIHSHPTRSLRQVIEEILAYFD